MNRYDQTDRFPIVGEPRNSSGNDGGQGHLIKTLGNLQDLRQRIYKKRKTDVVGRYGVDAAGEPSASKVPPIGSIP